MNTFQMPNTFQIPTAFQFPKNEQVAEMAKANVEAWVACGTAVTKGMEELTKAWFGFVNTLTEQSVAAAKASMTAKSFTEVLDVQSDYARNVYDAALAEGSKVSELSLKVANTASAPLNARVKEAWTALVPAAA